MTDDSDPTDSDPIDDNDRPDPRPSVSVVVVEPHIQGNVGTIARAMKNFGFSDLRLVSPPVLEPGDEAYGFAGHAREDVLENRTTTSFDAVVDEFHTIAFTAHPGEDERRHVRYPVSSPAALATDLGDRDFEADRPPIALVFGREDSGLSNAELARMDEVCSIPANSTYPVLNLGQAATIALYELRGLAGHGDQLPARARGATATIEGLYEQLDALLGAIGHPEEKQPKAARLFRRVFGRARLTGREATTLRGVFRRATELAEASTEQRRF